jgi:hypothetical protein
MAFDTDSRNWLERLSQKIPGYAGYVDRERRRDIDKLHREHLADRIRALKAPIIELMRQLTDTGRLMEIGPLDAASKKVDRLENRIRFASYGYSGFFDVVKIEQPQLDAIYRFDLEMIESVEKLEMSAGELKNKSNTAESLKAGVTEFSAEVESADKRFDERYRAINDFGQGQAGEQAPGRPLFS